MIHSQERIKELMDKYQASEQCVIDALDAAHEFKQFLGNGACANQLAERLLETHTEVKKFPCQKS
jgi:hypothetical protein